MRQSSFAAASGHSAPSGKAGIAIPGTGRASFGHGSASTTSMKWAALQDAGAAVAALAGLQAQPSSREIRNFPAIIRDCGGWRLESAERGIADLAAIMEPGLAALLSARARGSTAPAAAEALWHEFHAAQSAILALAPVNGTHGPRRSA
jgi:hypothetical protein